MNFFVVKLYEDGNNELRSHFFDLVASEEPGMTERKRTNQSCQPNKIDTNLGSALTNAFSGINSAFSKPVPEKRNQYNSSSYRGADRSSSSFVPRPNASSISVLNQKSAKKDPKAMTMS